MHPVSTRSTKPTFRAAAAVSFTSKEHRFIIHICQILHNDAFVFTNNDDGCNAVVFLI